MASSILYRNDQDTLFLIDIPTSIALAQHLPSSSPSLSSPEIESASQDATAATALIPRRQIYSTPALTTPFPSPPEPKRDTARARVLARTPESERRFHEGIVPFVRGGLEEIRDSFKKDPPGAERRMWCLPRKVMQKEEVSKPLFSAEDLTPDDVNSGPPTKKLRKGTRMGTDNGSRITALLNESKGNATFSIDARPGPPLILSPHVNEFSSPSELQNAEVQNPSSKPTVIRVHHDQPSEESTSQEHITFHIPPESCFVLCTLATPHISQPRSSHAPIPGLPENKKFNLILFDPPWPNRSVRRAANYATHSPFEMEGLSQMIRDIIVRHLHSDHSIDSITDGGDRQGKDQHQTQPPIVAIWVTNKAKSRTVAYEAIQNAGLSVHEEWIWLKTTTEGEPVTPLDGLWRKPYEVLVIGKRRDDQPSSLPLPLPKRRLIVAVPDVHSRKPHLKEILEALFFSSSPSSSSSVMVNAQQRRTIKYSALEVFARNLTAGWCACGDEVLKFNADEWWVG